MTKLITWLFLGFLAGFSSMTYALAQKPQIEGLMASGEALEATTTQSELDLCGLEANICPGERQVRLTAYEAVEGQTDSSPCHAGSVDLCAMHRAGINTCATGLYPKGTSLWINGLGTCVVMDIQAPRYRHQIDWFCGERPSSTECVQQVMKLGITSVVPL